MANACDHSYYVGYTVARLQSLIASAEAAMESASLGKMVQRVAMGDMSVAYSNGDLALKQIQSTLSALRAALKAAQAAPDGVVPEVSSSPLRAVLPWPA